MFLSSTFFTQHTRNVREYRKLNLYMDKGACPYCSVKEFSLNLEIKVFWIYSNVCLCFLLLMQFDSLVYDILCLRSLGANSLWLVGCKIWIVSTKLFLLGLRPRMQAKLAWTSFARKIPKYDRKYTGLSDCINNRKHTSRHLEWIQNTYFNVRLNSFTLQ